MIRIVSKFYATLAVAAMALSLASLQGCASQPVPKERVTVVLLPQSDAQGQPIPTAVTVTQGQQKVALTQGLTLVETGTGGALVARPTTSDEVQARYPQVLKVQPPSPEHFRLSFVSGKSQLTPESEQLLPQIMQMAKARAGGEIVITGHTDRVGSLEANDALSLQRAQAIANLFRDKGFPGDLITAIGRGEREPLVPTADEVAEPRNRRADIIIR